MSDLQIIGLVIAALLVALVSLIVIVVKPRAIWWMAGVVIFSSAIGGVVQLEERLYGIITQSFLQPLQENRHFAYIGASAIIALAGIILAKRIRLGRVPMTGIALLMLGLVVSALEGYHTDPLTGLITLGTIMCAMGGLTFALGSFIDEPDDWYIPVRVIAFAALVWIACAFIQTLINVKGVQLGNQGRFRGMSSNPQQAATFMGIASVALLFLCVNEPRLRWRPFWYAALPFALLMVGWTGSRTGAAMVTIGSIVVLYRRLGRFVLFLPVLGLGLVLAVKLASSFDSEVQIDRLTSLEDTRSAAWLRMIDIIRSDTLLGVGARAVGVSENSYLYAFAGYGIMGFLLSLLVAIIVVVQSWQLWRLRSQLSPAFERVAEYIIVNNFIILASSFFEGFLVARVAVMNVLLIVFAAMTCALKHYASQNNSAHVLSETIEGESTEHLNGQTTSSLS